MLSSKTTTFGARAGSTWLPGGVGVPGGLVVEAAAPGGPAPARPAHQLRTILAAVDITLVYLPAFGAERGLKASAIGLLLTIRGVASMTSRLFLGRLTALT